MSSLNLVPNPTVLVVQTGVFLANLVVIKKLWVDPYLKMKQRREDLTVGNQAEATRLIAENENLTKKIGDSVQAAYQTSRDLREGLKVKATEQKQTIITAAETEVKKNIAEMSQRISTALREEKAKIPQLAAKLSDEIYKALIN